MSDSLGAVSRELLRLERAIVAEDTAATPPLPHPLGTLSTAVLEHLASSGPERPSAVAAHLDLSRPAASRVLRKLESRGFVVIRASDADRRAREVLVTVLGREALAAQRAARQSAIARIFAEWSESEISALAGSLARLNDRVIEVWRGTDDDRGRTEATSNGDGTDPPRIKKGIRK